MINFEFMIYKLVYKFILTKISIDNLLLLIYFDELIFFLFNFFLFHYHISQVIKYKLIQLVYSLPLYMVGHYPTIKS
jgi:hypothetical protein